MNERLQAIQTAIEFIEDHLHKPITVADIAEVTGYSLYHFIRTFNQIVQHTPYDYLMRRRLSEAALALLDRERRVVDISLDFQFNNHETFTRAFGRIYGMPPTRWREQEIIDDRLIMPAFSREILGYLNSSDFVPPRLVSMDEIILAGLMTPLTADPDEVPVLWQNLHKVLRSLKNRPRHHDFWGMRIHTHISDVRSYYLAAVKIPVVESISGVFVTKHIPAGEFICCSLPNQFTDVSVALIVLYHTYFSKTDLTLTDPYEIEHFGEQREVFLPVDKPSLRQPIISKKIK